jgi:DNA-binding response OmpR family regulator
MATILYVDDEEAIGRLVSRFFTRRGDRVLLANSITDARTILATEEPDAIFIDVWLGKESGVELVRWIAETRPSLFERVTFVTGELVEQGDNWALGGKIERPVIRKPFELAALAHFIDDAGPRAGT